MRPVLLCLGDSDPSGGDGIQADLKTACALRVYAATALTAVTVQNTAGHRYTHPLPADLVGDQLDAVLDDLDVHAVKVGRLGSATIADLVAARLDRWRERRPLAVVLDPALDGDPGDGATATVVRDRLLPRATVVTANLAEAGTLLDRPTPTDLAEMTTAALALRHRGAEAAVVTGSGLTATAVAAPGTDVLAGEVAVRTLEADHMVTPHTRGAGSTFATAVACGLITGLGVVETVSAAKAYLSGALAAGSAGVVGHGRGPVDHLWRRR